MDEMTNLAVWRALLSNSGLEKLRLATINGRVDLRESSLPKAFPKFASKGVLLNKAVWTALDFQGADLRGIHFSNCNVSNCRFDLANCRDWKVWSSRFDSTSFVGADLRGSALGATRGTSVNSYLSVDFSQANLEDTTYVSADFVDCRYHDSKLTGVDFQGSVFRRCIFSGLLDEVLFYRKAFGGAEHSPNEMEGVDFSNAILRFVEFRGIDMASVKWPSERHHWILEDYIPSISKLAEVFSARSDFQSRKAASIFNLMLKWAGPGQRRGVIGKLDIEEAGGTALVAEVEALLAAIRAGG